MKQPFTPGPWRFERGIANHEQEERTAAGSIIDDTDGWRLAKIKVNGPSPEADGQLMAASPDLLKELEHALPLIDGAVIDAQCALAEIRKNNPRLVRDAESALQTQIEQARRARAAIAKAVKP